METETSTIFIGTWDGRDFVFSLVKEKAISLVESCIAFGDPSEAEYVLGNTWASEDQEVGWRIVERMLTVPVIGVDLKLSLGVGVSHVVWQCPFCRKLFSDDWHPDDKLPVLLSCGCEKASKFLLGIHIEN